MLIFLTLYHHFEKKKKKKEKASLWSSTLGYCVRYNSFNYSVCLKVHQLFKLFKWELVQNDCEFACKLTGECKGGVHFLNASSEFRIRTLQIHVMYLAAWILFHSTFQLHY